MTAKGVVVLTFGSISKILHHWLKSNIPDFIAADDWPLGSPDLKPMTAVCGQSWKTWPVEYSTEVWRVSKYI